MNFPFVISVTVACLGLGVGALALGFSTAPGWKDQRWFALVVLSAALYEALDSITTIDVPSGWRVPFAHWSLFFAGLHSVAWLGLTGVTLGIKHARTQRWLIFAALVLSTSTLVPGLLYTGELAYRPLPWAHITYYDAITTQVGWVLFGLFCVLLNVALARLYRAWRNRQPQAGWATLSLAAISLASINDAIAGSGVANLPYLLGPGFLLCVVTMGVAVTQRFLASARALDELSRELEGRVLQRTRELDEARLALMRAEKLGALGQLAAGVAHEINNPAGAVVANLDYLRAELKTGVMTNEAQACIDESLASMRRIGSIVRQLLTAGRAAAHNVTSAAPVRLLEPVEEALGVVLGSQGGRVPIVLAVPEDCWVVGEKDLLTQVLTNLLANAVQAIPDGRADGRVDVRVAVDGPRVDLRVIDNGEGMSEETQRRIFEPFFTTKRQGDGTGLGLAVSLGLLRTMGATVRVESALGLGTTMHISLAASDEGTRGAGA